MLHGINNIKLNFLVCLQNFNWKNCIDYQYSIQYLSMYIFCEIHMIKFLFLELYTGWCAYSAIKF